MIAILIASRGLIFTETDQFIDEIQDRFDTKIIRTYDKKIPDSQNYLAEQALATTANYFLFIEEDIVGSVDHVVQMINADCDISFVDYAVSGWSCSMREKTTGEILWCGLGCTLIKRQVFEALEKPYFRTDKKFRLNTMRWVDVKGDDEYGGQDIWFFLHAIEKGFQIKQIPGECRHLGLGKLGKKEINTGLHSIFEKPKIERQQVINLLNRKEVLPPWLLKMTQPTPAK